LDDSADTVGTDASEDDVDSRYTMARSKSPLKPPAPEVDSNSDPDADAKAEEQAKQDDAVKWYTDVLGFPEASAKALYIDQTLTNENVLRVQRNKI